jgi:hypothetical protein
LRYPWSNVIYYSPENTFVALDGISSANGITSNEDRSLIYLSACFGAAVHILKPNENSTLTQLDRIKLDFFNDNPSYDPETGAVFVTGHVKPLEMKKGAKIPGVPVAGPSKVIKLTKDASNHYQVDTVLLDDGHLISTGTTAAVDRKHGVMLVGTAFGSKGLIKCPIPQGV